MNKILSKSILALSLLSPTAFSSGVSGSGCAVSEEGTTFEVTLQGGTIDKQHGALQVGSRIRRAVTFSYDLSNHTQGCANEFVRITASELTQFTSGPLQFDASAIRANSWGGSGIENSNVVVLASEQATQGLITLEALYTVMSPDIGLLTQAFEYEHTFKVEIKALASPINDIDATPPLSPV